MIASCSLVARPSVAADVKITDAARQHFNAGVALLKDPDGARYEDAYREFKAAYEASPSWKILGNLGICAMKLERDSEAIAAFSRYLEEGKKDIDASERADIERDLGTLRASAVSLELTTTPADVVITDERTPVTGSRVRNRYQAVTGVLRLQIRPGHHVVTASAAGKPSQTFELDAEPGGSYQHAFDLSAEVAAPPPTPSPSPTTPAASAPTPTSRPVPTSVWVGLAATGALAVGAGVTGALALGKNSDYEKANGTDTDALNLRDQTKTLNLVTDVLIGAAVVGAGVTTFLYLRRPQRDSAFDLRLAPRVGWNHSGLSVEGAFR
jgi:hypothetical protein